MRQTCIVNNLKPQLNCVVLSGLSLLQKCSDPELLKLMNEYHLYMSQRRKDIRIKNDFMSIESTLNAIKVSTFKVLNMFLENKMSNVRLSFSVTIFM